MAERATGPFEVTMTPMAAVEGVGDPTVGRMALAKSYRGDLVGTGRGEMLATHGSVKGSAGYVAIERIEGTLHGKSGSFALQHAGTMDRGTPTLSITVVPDSGTGELVGLAGRLNIRNDAGAHTYEFDYTMGDGA